ncbi:MAG: YlxM family DNA-binding protein [Alicyclobacillus sp.]|nr:YlxM family DNA-binding protein [Alicyclobacillus sp.]
MEKVTRLGVLFDFYSGLLTARQRDMVELHYFDDWSLAEIAEHFGVTRQAVHDNLRRAEEQLEAYEATLQLMAVHEARKAKLTALQSAWEQASAYVPDVQRQLVDERLAALAAEI